MTLAMFVLWVVVGSIVGYLAGYVMTEGAYGPIGLIRPRGPREPRGVASCPGGC